MDARGDRGTVPVIVGVIGHRTVDAEQHDRIRNDVMWILQEHESQLPHTEIVVLTSLAEGADSLGAEAAHMRKLPVLALLPFPSAEFADDFTGDALEHYRELLERATATMAGQSVADGGRDAAYQRCARELAATSGTLVAVWNGAEPDLPAGTADTVHYTLQGVSGLPDLSGGPATLLSETPLVLRVDSTLGTPVAEVQSSGIQEPWSGAPDDASRRIDVFNREVKHLAVADTGSNSAITRLMISADAMALRLQRRHRRWTVILLALGVLVVSSVDAQQEIEQRWFFWSQLFGVAVMMALWWLLSRWRIKDRFQEYRALAEGARVQQVWLRCGLSDAVSDHYLESLGRSGYWIRRALRAAHLIDRMTVGSGDALSTARDWISGQVTYFDREGGAIDRAQRRSRRYGHLAVLFVVIALAGFVPDVLQFVLAIELAPLAVSICHVLWGVGIACAAACVAYSEVMGFEQSARRYRLASADFRQSLIDFDRATSDSERETVVRVAGVEALREAGDWLTMHASKNIRPV